MVEDANDAFDDVINAGEVAPVLAVVEHFDGFTRKDGFGMRNACAMPAGFGYSRYSMGAPPPTRAGAEQLPEARQVVRRGDEADFADAILDERGQRVIDYRLVAHRLELLCSPSA